MKSSRKVPFLAIAFVLWLYCLPSWAQQNVRVATYNIMFLNANVDQQGDRLEKLKEVIALLDADVIGLQEIDNRAALERVFPPADWILVIDDDSGDNQDVAVAVRRPLQVLGFPNNVFDADDQHFLFPGSANNSHFPNRRDLLAVEIKIPDQNITFFVMVHHAKARVGGRATTDPRREGAARDILGVLEQRFDEKEYIILGDFNDNPDDRSTNILEVGDPDAPGGPEQIEGPFLINLTEPLVVEDRVSHGRSSSNISNDRVETIDSGSRKRNNDARGTDQHTGDILFDQMLIPVRMLPRYVMASAQIFDDEVAVRGNDETRASDHLPVVAEFVFDQPEPEPGPGPAPAPAAVTLRIVSLLPDPVGTDSGNEKITLRNQSVGSVNLAGWKFRDRAGNEFELSGTIGAGATVAISMTDFSMPLNNSGDDISLIDPAGELAHHVTYTEEQVQKGVEITFQ